MRIEAFDFDLPNDRIALRPANPRESARLLTVSARGVIGDSSIADLPDLISPDDVLVFNDTRVIPAQLEGWRTRANAKAGEGRARISATLHLRRGANCWDAFVRPSKRVQVGDEIVFSKNADAAANGPCIKGTVEARGTGGEITLRFDEVGAELDSAVGLVGHIPLPPYIASKRAEDVQDRTDYQTVYAREQGAVAAPTAGLHFTKSLLERLAQKRIQTEFVTLHVGAGTFLPVKSQDTDDHHMHSEIGLIDASTADRLRSAKADGRRIVAVGTTSLRLLESATSPRGELREFAGSTDIFITPGYKFRFVDRLMTNFHLPRSTLFMLVSAFSGLQTMQAAYEHAIQSGYRFYSYGDACLLDRAAAA